MFARKWATKDYRMILFYTNTIRGDRAVFPPDEARHMGQVLRKRSGEPISFVDGTGGWYEGQIVNMGRDGAEVKILSRKHIPPPDYYFHLAIAPTKQPARMEWLLEKITEIGVQEISLLECAHSERQRVKLDRWERILQSAMKQSLQTYLPKLNPVQTFDHFLKSASGDQMYIGWCGEMEKEHLKNNLLPGKHVTIMIGPEGDFSEAEVQKAIALNVRPVTLGPHRLRTETAGLVACQIVNLINQ